MGQCALNSEQYKQYVAPEENKEETKEESSKEE